MLPNEPLDPDFHGEDLEGDRHECSMLQSLLVEPETEKLRDRIERLEREVISLKQNFKQLSERLTPYIDKLIERKLDEFRQELIDTINLVLEEMLDDRIAPGKIVSIPVKGLHPDS